MQGSKRDTDVKNRLLDSVGEGEGGMIWENSIETCLFNLYAEYIMRNAGLEEAQAGIKISGRNINNLRYADDTTFKVKKN